MDIKELKEGDGVRFSGEDPSMNGTIDRNILKETRGVVVRIDPKNQTHIIVAFERCVHNPPSACMSRRVSSHVPYRCEFWVRIDNLTKE